MLWPAMPAMSAAVTGVRTQALLPIERARDIMRQLLRFLHREDGPTAVEYAVMLALIVVTCMAGIQSLTRETANSYDRSSVAISDALASQ